MTNPNNAIGTNGAYGGRTSVEAANDILAQFALSGVLRGWAASVKSGMTISLGGDGSTRDVAIAEDNIGNKTTINNISGSPIDVTIPAAPASNSRIDLVVAYVDNPPQGSSTVIDNPAACGIIVVSGTAAATPSAPTDANIRSAITTDGATGAQAYYAILSRVTVASGTTTLTDDNLSIGSKAVPNQLIATQNPTLGYSVGSRLFRIGNVVVLICPPQTNSSIPQSTGGTAVAATIPEGYRPSEIVQIAVPSVNGRVGNAGITIGTDGSIEWFSEFTSSYGWRMAFNATWVTEDDYPVEDIMSWTE